MWIDRVGFSGFFLAQSLARLDVITTNTGPSKRSTRRNHPDWFLCTRSFILWFISLDILVWSESDHRFAAKLLRLQLRDREREKKWIFIAKIAWCLSKVLYQFEVWSEKRNAVFFPSFWLFTHCLTFCSTNQARDFWIYISFSRFHCSLLLFFLSLFFVLCSFVIFMLIEQHKKKKD